MVGVLIAGLLILSQSGWMPAVAVRTSGLLSTGVTPAFATLVRALPSGWGLYAVEAAGRSDWLTAVGVLAGLAAAIELLLLAWSWKLSSPGLRARPYEEPGGSGSGVPARCPVPSAEWPSRSCVPGGGPASGCRR